MQRWLSETFFFFLFCRLSFPASTLFFTLLSWRESFPLRKIKSRKKSWWTWWTIATLRRKEACQGLLKGWTLSSPSSLNFTLLLPVPLFYSKEIFKKKKLDLFLLSREWSKYEHSPRLCFLITSLLSLARTSSSSPLLCLCAMCACPSCIRLATLYSFAHQGAKRLATKKAAIAYICVLVIRQHSIYTAPPCSDLLVIASGAQRRLFDIRSKLGIRALKQTGTLMDESCESSRVGKERTREARRKRETEREAKSMRE